jgi:hypothetical protein
MIRAFSVNSTAMDTNKNGETVTSESRQKPPAQQSVWLRHEEKAEGRDHKLNFGFTVSEPRSGDRV